MLRPLLLAAMLAGSGVAAYADDCKEDLGKQEAFGSYEQLTALQRKVGAGCTAVLLEYEQKLPNGRYRESGIALDLAAAQMFRFSTLLGQTSWESWRGFTREQFMNDDPSDGFDLPGYSSKGNPQEGSAALQELLSR